MSRPIDARLLAAAPTLRRLLIGYAATQVVSAVATVGVAVGLAQVLTGIVAGRPIAGSLGWLAVAGVIRALGNAAQGWLGSRGSLRVQRELRAEVLHAIRRLGPAWVQRQPSGRLVSAGGPALDTLDGYLTRALPAIVSAAVVPLIGWAWIALVDWRSALILAVIMPLVPLFMAIVGITTGRRMRERYEVLARLSGRFLDLVSGLTSLRIYGRAHHQVATVRRASEQYRRHTMATLRSAFLSGLVLDVLATLSVAVVAVDVGLRLDHGSLGLPAALVVLLLTPEVFAPLRAVGSAYHATEEGRTVAGAALDVLAEADQVGATPVSAAHMALGTVSFNDVTVDYGNRDRPALSALSLTVSPGEVVALRGRSGAGKSTVLACLLGFVQPDGGTVSLSEDRRSLDDVDTVELREQLAWVPQRPQPTQRCVLDEVRLGDPAATDAQVRSAIAACRAPVAETGLGEGGCSVSAGQRRRVALARALLRARAVLASGRLPLVLLDEPSEDLDPTTEKVVVSMLAALAGRATVLVATHSDVVAAGCDRVVELAGGRVHGDRWQRALRTPAPEAAAELLPVSLPARGATGRAIAVLPTRRTAWIVARAGLISGLAGLAGLALTATSIWLICRAAAHPNVQALAIAVVGVRTFALGRAALRYAERLVTHDGALRLLAEVRVRVFAALIPIVPTVALRRGDLLRRFVVDVDNVQDGIVRALVPASAALVAGAGAAGLATALVPDAGLALATGLVVAGCLVPLVVRVAAGRSEQAAPEAAERDSAITVLLDGIIELTAYDADAQAVRAALERDTRLAASTARRDVGSAIGIALAGMASAVTLPVVLGLAADARVAGQVSGPTAAVLAACVLAGFEAVSVVPAAWTAWTNFRAGLRRIAELFGHAEEVAEPAVPAEPPSTAVGVSLRRAAVSPDATIAPVVTELSFAVGTGRRVAVVGPSGCGKSTVLATVLRLYPPRAGRVTLDSADAPTDLADVPSDAMSPLVAGSLQGDHVFDASLRDNLRVVRPAATDAELDEVAARSGLTEFVRALPSGWSTPAGSDGALLSGGQRQRLLLARALLAAPQVLVLDEPTAHLDTETEREVLAELLGATSAQTVLLSTHRPLPDSAVDSVVTLS